MFNDFVFRVRFNVYSLEIGRTAAYKKATAIAWCHAVEVGTGRISSGVSDFGHRLRLDFDTTNGWVFWGFAAFWVFLVEIQEFPRFLKG